MQAGGKLIQFFVRRAPIGQHHAAIGLSLRPLDASQVVAASPAIMSFATSLVHQRVQLQQRRSGGNRSRCAVVMRGLGRFFIGGVRVVAIQRLVSNALSSGGTLGEGSGPCAGHCRLEGIGYQCARGASAAATTAVAACRYRRLKPPPPLLPRHSAAAAAAELEVQRHPGIGQVPCGGAQCRCGHAEQCSFECC